MENKSWFRQAYKLVVGEFDFKTLIYLISVFIVTAVLPFARPGFNAEDITVMFIIITVMKMAINLYTKRVMAVNTVDRGLLTDKEVVEAHEQIKKYRKDIEVKAYTRFLPRAVREENLKVDLDTLYDKINEDMAKTKDDVVIMELTEILEKIELCLDNIEKGLEYEHLKRDLTHQIARIKRSSLTVSSLYSKNDTTARAKRYSLDIDGSINKMMVRSASVSIGLVAIINLTTFIFLGFNQDTVIQSILNTAMLVVSGVFGVDGGRKIVKSYINVANEKLEFLKSFFNKAEHYAKPTAEELKQKAAEEKELQERKIQEEKDKQERERQAQLEELKRQQEFELEKLRIQAEIEKAKVSVKENKPVELVIKTEANK